MEGADLTGEVTTADGYTMPAEGEERFSVAAIDLGIKANTPRMLAPRGIRTHVLPASTTIEQIKALGSTEYSCPTALATPRLPTRSWS